MQCELSQVVRKLAQYMVLRIYSKKKNVNIQERENVCAPNDLLKKKKTREGEEDDESMTKMKKKKKKSNLKFAYYLKLSPSRLFPGTSKEIIHSSRWEREWR